MKTPQSVLKMSIVIPDTGRETATPLTNDCNNNPSVKLSVSVLQDVTKIKRLKYCKGITQASLEMQLKLCHE